MLQTSTVAKDNQTNETTDYEYRVPRSENLARRERSHMDSDAASLANQLQVRSMERIKDVYQNELASIDTDVNQLQIAYLNTILLSPFPGTVTGVYKNVGDPVRPGEPVFRVENNDEVLIVARIVCRGRIAVGSSLQVKTTLFGVPSAAVSVTAPIVAARGQGEDDQWEVIAKCKNRDAAGKSIFPLGYTFDYDNTDAGIL